MPDQDSYCDEILSGRVPVRMVAETASVMAFFHVFRMWDTHIVVIPKTHVRGLSDVEDPQLLVELFQMVARVIGELGLEDSNYKVVINGGAYQYNKHLHIHVVSGEPLDPTNPFLRRERVL